jgi:mono/diheme cytochrome c family protein
MYTGILHTHTLLVILFLVLYLIKTGLLLLDKETALQKVTKITKIPEMIISFGFLATGFYLLFNSGNVGTMVYVKVVMVFASIPLAIIGFKKRNKVLSFSAFLLILLAYGLAEMNKKQSLKKSLPDIAQASGPLEQGKIIYTTYCESCHGSDGAAMRSGAKNLAESSMRREEKVAMISKGKGVMAGYEKILNDEQIEAVTDYIETFSRRQ